MEKEKNFIINETQIDEIKEYLENHSTILANDVLDNLPELEEENNDMQEIIKRDEDISG